MSSPTIKALLARLSSATSTTNSTSSTISSSSGGFKTVYVGKDQHPVTISELEPVKSPAWKKAAGFNQLTHAVSSLLDTHDVADLISLISQELPISTNVAFQEAQAEANKIMVSVLDVDNLTASAFVNSSGKVVKLKSDALDKRPEGITYFRFGCDINPAARDKRIKQAPFTLQFCLKLPQHLYYVNNGHVVDANTPQKKNKMAGMIHATAADNAARSLDFGNNKDNSENKQDKNDSDRDEEQEEQSEEEEEEQGEPKPVNETPQRNTAPPATASFGSPKMSLIIQSSSSMKSGYFGPLTFLDSQQNFNSIFGKKPVILPSNPNRSDLSSTRQELQNYCDMCKLDIYIYICGQDYVGSDTVDSALNIQEISRKITSLKQTWKDKSGKIRTDSPDDLFNKFLQVSYSLPDNVQEWPLQLCTSFYSALSPELSEKMATELFKMPSLTQLDTKAKQLEALRTVRTHAATCYKALEEEEERVNKMLRAAIGSGRKGNMLYTDTATEHNNTGEFEQERSNNGQVFYQRSLSQAETTLQRYKGNDNVTKPNYIPPITKTDPTTGVAYPYDEENDYVSRFPAGFRGCYMCGSHNHFKRADCPDGNTNDEQKKKQFFLDMWAHRPHTKRSNRDVSTPQAIYQ